MKTSGLLLYLCLLLLTTTAQASHSFAGLDMCKLYPEIMPPGIALSLLPEAGSHAPQLMQGYCTQCHEMPGPGRHTADEWPGVLKHMFMLMDVSSRFSGLMGNVKTPAAAERILIENYLTQYALQPLAYKPQGYGASAFENQCSSCHALPDPQQYRDLDWHSVLQRMQAHMHTMKRTPPSTEVMMKIRVYLQQFNTDNLSATNTSTNHATQPAFNNASLLALGPFFILVILGIYRWYKQHNQITSNGNQL